MNRRSLLLGIIAGGSSAVAVPPILVGGSRTPSFSRDTTGESPVDPRSSVASDGASTTLRIARNDVQFMNRIFRERTHEIAYCGLVEGQRLQPWLADTVSADESGTSFTVDNCPDGTANVRGTIHTHPAGNPALSATDRETFYRSDRDFMCIQSGSITTTEGASPDQLRCYRRVTEETEEAVRVIPLEVVPDDQSGGRIMAP